MARTTISLDPQTYRRAKEEAARRGISFAELVRRSLSQTLRPNEMAAVLTIRVDEPTVRALREVAERSGTTPSEVAREALRRQLALARFEQMRERVAPFAALRGYLTDEDLFREIS